MLTKSKTVLFLAKGDYSPKAKRPLKFDLPFSTLFMCLLECGSHPAHLSAPLAAQGGIWPIQWNIQWNMSTSIMWHCQAQPVMPWKKPFHTLFEFGSHILKTAEGLVRLGSLSNYMEQSYCWPAKLTADAFPERGNSDLKHTEVHGLLGLLFQQHSLGNRKFLFFF